MNNSSHFTSGWIQPKLCFYPKLNAFRLFAEKLAFVGFKGSFVPDWVHLEVGADRAKVHQVLPVPVVHMMKLWGAGGAAGKSRDTLHPLALNLQTDRQEEEEEKKTDFNIFFSNLVSLSLSSFPPKPSLSLSRCTRPIEPCTVFPGWKCTLGYNGGLFCYF